MSGRSEKWCYWYWCQVTIFQRFRTWFGHRQLVIIQMEASRCLLILLSFFDILQRDSTFSQPICWDTLRYSEVLSIFPTISSQGRISSRTWGIPAPKAQRSNFFSHFFLCPKSPVHPKGRSTFFKFPRCHPRFPCCPETAASACRTKWKTSPYRAWRRCGKRIWQPALWWYLWQPGAGWDMDPVFQPTISPIHDSAILVVEPQTVLHCSFSVTNLPKIAKMTMGYDGIQWDTDTISRNEAQQRCCYVAV